MSRTKKIIFILIVCIIGFFAMIISDWFRFVMWGKIDQRRGVYGNNHLEVWIDINARMPTPARIWACRVLREREKQVLGGQNTLPPYSCQPDFGAYPTPSSRAEAVIRSIGHGAANMAIRRGALMEAQKPAFVECIAAELHKTTTQEQRDALNAGKTEPGLLQTLNAAARSASDGCAPKAGS